MAALFLRPPAQAAAVLMRRHHEVRQLGTKWSHPRRRQRRSIARSAGQATDSSSKELPTTTTTAIKASLSMALQGINRGIFGITSAKKSEIEALVQLLESHNPTPHPTHTLLDTVDGRWRVVYSTVTVLGAKRTKLGLRDFINLGDFFQIIDVAKGKAINVIEFNARGFKMIAGHLTIEASFNIVSKTRVDIKLENSSITPDQLRNLFQKNYDLLLAIFNPEGWLEISYVDDSTRIGRDDKGNIFVLERAKQEEV